MRGYFGIGIDGVSKVGNAGNLIRTANSFGANFAFMLNTNFRRDIEKFDTAKTASTIPVFEGASLQDINLPLGIQLVGIEITEDAIDLPSFPHPTQAAYILGGERLSLSPDVVKACEFMVKIPTKFSLNVATAGAIVMYDRLRALGRFAQRPVWSGGAIEDMKSHSHGGPIFRQGNPKSKHAARKT